MGLSSSSSSLSSSPSPSLSLLKSIPFSWEEEPGISKSGSPDTPKGNEEFTGLGLPLPPFRAESVRRLPAHGLYIPLPPCPSRPSAKVGSEHHGKRGKRRVQDPFLAAYMECTKSEKESKGRTRGVLSCKYVGGVREDAIVRLSRVSGLPPRRDF